MTADGDLAALAELCGILPGYRDLQGVERDVSSATRRALLAASGVDVSDDAAIRDSLAALRRAAQERRFPEEVIVDSGAPAPLSFGEGAAWSLRLDGEEAEFAQGRPSGRIDLPPLPPGVHELTVHAPGRAETVTVLAAPKRLASVETRTGAARLWGLNAALYGVRSERNAGVGDFEDLARLAEIAGGQGAAFLGVNPLHNMGFADLTAISPYSPSHRGFLNTACIALDRIPGLREAPDMAEFEPIRKADAIAYRDHKRAHNRKLEALFESFAKTAALGAREDFAAFRARGGAGLAEFARFEALSEIHGSDWRTWPRDAGEAPAPRVEFHMWLQWVANAQLAAAQARAGAAGMPLGLYLDLAVGPRRDGAECWCERSAIAQGVSIGAPPDHLSPEGQNWSLAAFAPRKLKALKYAPLRRILAQTMRHAGVIRIDHALGLSRSFWIPDDGSPGGYVRQPFEALLAVIKIEAERRGCVVIGEDLGLVPQGFRETMREHGFYGYSVLQYEKDADGAFRDPGGEGGQVLSCFATHDTPTVRGYELGRDIDWWEKLNWIDAPTAEAMRRRRAAEVAAIARGGDFQTSVHALLARSKAALVAVQLDDVLGAAEAQNLPGTIDQHPNWRRRYAVPLEDLPGDDRLTAIAAMMRDAGRAAFSNGAEDED